MGEIVEYGSAAGGYQAAADMGGAVDFLQGHPAVRGSGLGVVGFCMGGGLALWLATLRPDAILAAVCFYGLAPRGKQPDWSKLAAAVEGYYAEHDDLAGFGAARQLEAELTEAGKEVRVFLYPGTAHAFFNDTRPEVYDPDAARQAWVRTLEFLRASWDKFFSGNVANLPGRPCRVVFVKHFTNSLPEELPWLIVPPL
ncbi:MAG: dienelactone hydrolase family protein [Acidimicrobiales bacterium]